MSAVRILPEKVASQIAAGEVVERPASVVRELIDNSIDAGADAIVVEMESGGRRRIRVKDNGAGMARDDLLLCVERHATSKIESISDLFSVQTLGFRGEALPSIAAVSKMELVSRPAGEIAGHRFKIHGGKPLSIEETGCPKGTTVEVRDLFFNLPARRKFLRAPRTEAGYVTDCFIRIALPYLGAGFRLEEDGKVVLNLPPSENDLTRLSILLGRDVAEVMAFAREKIGPLELRGYFAPPRFSRSRGDRLFVYSNGRNIRDRLVNKAILEGFGQRLMKGQYPQAVIFMDHDPSLADVNVHPTKQEVRFQNAQEVFRSVRGFVEKALKSAFRPALPPRDQAPWPSKDAGGDAPFLSSEPLWSYSERGEQGGATSGDVSLSPRGGEGRNLFERNVPKVIGQLSNTYILCQAQESLLIVDQHAAHERILYEKLRNSLAGARMDVQSFLVPPRLELSSKEGRIALEKQDQLLRLGIELEHFGGNTFLLRAAPAILKKVDWDAFLPDLVSQMEGGALENGQILHNVLSVMACHGAIRAGQALTREEMNRVLDQLEEMELPTNCPHGRPVFSRLEQRELEKMFKRIV